MCTTEEKHKYTYMAAVLLNTHYHANLKYLMRSLLFNISEYTISTLKTKKPINYSIYLSTAKRLDISI